VLVVNGKTVLEDQKKIDWAPAYTALGYASFGDSLLLLAVLDDCVDVLIRRLVILNRDGEYIHQTLWSPHWKGGLFPMNGELIYWSEWFCHPGDKQRNGGDSYVYVFSPSTRAWARKDVAYSMYCPAGPTVRPVLFEPAPLLNPESSDSPDLD
jgi:hypothetical protein